ncbi:MAG: hypothetical protein WDN75_13890 [Bacteroidota bacterium]
MKKFLFIILLLPAFASHAQSRIYISGGVTTALGGSIDTYSGSSALPSFDVEYERRIVGSMGLLTGISFYGVGYDYDGTGFASNTSNFRADYLAIPLMARWNMFNKQSLYFDFGMVASYMAKANLKETFYKFNVPQTAEGDISGYSNRILLGAKFQETIAFNRFTVSIFMIISFKGQNTIKDLPEHWPLNQQQSTYLLSNGYSDFLLGGVKLGVRIK